MSRHTLAEAQARLPELIARARAGEEVAIVLEDGATIGLRPDPRSDAIPPVPQDNGEALRRWLALVRGEAPPPGAPDAATLVRQMRDGTV